MQQIADWLEKLGMSEYAERFADNKIDTSVLPHLTDQDLCRCEYSSPRTTWKRLSVPETPSSE